MSYVDAKAIEGESSFPLRGHILNKSFIVFVFSFEYLPSKVIALAETF